MSKTPGGRKPPTKDMYWFAHGGIEKGLPQRNNEPEDESSDSSYPSLKSNADRRNASEENRLTPSKEISNNHEVDGMHNSSTLSFAEREDRVTTSPSVEKKKLWETEQERLDAMQRKRIEREAALEARRNAARSTIAFAFGSSVPRNLESPQSETDKANRTQLTSTFTSKEENFTISRERHSISPMKIGGQYSTLVVDNSPRSILSQTGANVERKIISPPCWLIGSGALIGDDVMSQSMTSSMITPRGRRKNDLTPTVPYDRTGPPRSTPTSSTCTSTRKRSVSMTRLDQLAKPRRHYVEATKASSAANSVQKENLRSPTRPLSSASEQSGSAPQTQLARRRTRTSPKKPRPFSIAGTIPDQKPEVKVSPIKKASTPVKKLSSPDKKTLPSTAKPKQSNEISRTPASKVPKETPSKVGISPKKALPKIPSTKKTATNKKKADILVASSPIETTKAITDVSAKVEASPSSSPTPDDESNAENVNVSKKIISEEEAKAALAEKRRLAREQAEKEAELERQRQEELKREEEERLRKEEEEQKRLEEEQLRLLEEHKKQEEEKLRKAIEEQAKREEEERLKREEELRLKLEHEKKAKEEAEKQRIELEEKLRKEEEERAERKKRLEKIMSRTRGKSAGTSPSGSISGSDQMDSSENQPDGSSSGANSLESNENVELQSGPTSLDDNQTKSQPSSVGNSMEANPTYEVVSETESLNSNDLMMATSEPCSQDNSLTIIPPENAFESIDEKDSVVEQLSLENDFPSVKNEMSHGENAPSEIPLDNLSSTNESFIPEINDKPAEELLPEPSSPFVEEVHYFESEQKNEHELSSHFNIEDVPTENLTSSLEQNIPDQIQLSNEGDIKRETQSDDVHSSENNPDSSSEMKLPDPIYETTSSDDGSYNERMHPLDNYMFQKEEATLSENNLTDNMYTDKDIMQFSSQEDCQTSHFISNQATSEYNPFQEHVIENEDILNYEKQVEAEELTQVPQFVNEPGSHDEALEHATEIQIESDILAEPSLLTKYEEPTFGTIVQPLELNEENKENFGIFESSPSTVLNNPFLTSQPDTMHQEHIEENKENISNIESFEQLFNVNEDNKEVPFYSSEVTFSETYENVDTMPLDQYTNNSQEIPFDFEKQSANNYSDITIIKAEESGDCIGIISSLDNDAVNSDFPKLEISNQTLKHNLEYDAVATDSEDSSLDSNLSQVMTVELNETETNNGLTYVETLTESKLGASTKQSECLANETVQTYCNGEGISNTNGGHVYSDPAISNGHLLESAEHAIYQMPELSNQQEVKSCDISSVDQHMDNIFENAGTFDYNKVSPDPFLVKGNASQISGNPFLVQDEPKQVLTAPDFYN